MDMLLHIVNEIRRFKRNVQRPARYVRIDLDTWCEILASPRAFDYITQDARDSFIMGIPLIIERDAPNALYDEYLYRWIDI
jgi:hypothetical protein